MSLAEKKQTMCLGHSQRQGLEVAALYLHKDLRETVDRVRVP